LTSPPFSIDGICQIDDENGNGLLLLIAATVDGRVKNDKIYNTKCSQKKVPRMGDEH
jgi:hypothetical protein